MKFGIVAVIQQLGAAGALEVPLCEDVVDGDLEPEQVRACASLAGCTNFNIPD